MVKKKSSDRDITLKDIKLILGNDINKSLVYKNATGYYIQGRYDLQWIYSVLIRELIDNSGSIDTDPSLRSNIVNKVLTNNSKVPFESLHQKLTEDFSVVKREEVHLYKLLNHAAFLRNAGGISFSNEQLAKIPARRLDEMDSLSPSPEGTELAKIISNRLINNLDLQIKKQCLLLQDTEDDSYDLKNIDPFKLISAVLITSLNIRNVFDEIEEKGLPENDILSLNIAEYLSENPKKTESTDNGSITGYITENDTQDGGSNVLVNQPVPSKSLPSNIRHTDNDTAKNYARDKITIKKTIGQKIIPLGYELDPVTGWELRTEEGVAEELEAIIGDIVSEISRQVWDSYNQNQKVRILYDRFVNGANSEIDMGNVL